MLSILSNFGCHFGCSYCVYRENGINIPPTDYKTFGWKELEEELKSREGELISISGGGDPLYKHSDFGNHIFYSMLFDLLRKYKCTLELHTSIIVDNFPYHECERVVFHLNMPTQMSMINNRHLMLPKLVRAVFVVQEHYTKALINEITKNANAGGNVINELSFRQMIDSNGKATDYLHDYLKESHMKEDKWYYIEQYDYNDYFVQDHIEKEYLKII